MPTQIHPTEQDLRSYALGKLPHGASDSVARHLDSCPACSDTIGELDLQQDTLVAALRDTSIINISKRTGVLSESIIERASARALEAKESPVDFGSYRLLEKIGVGGMGAVYRAEHTRLGREVALKLLPADKKSSAEWIARFTREMKAVGTLRHANVVQALDAGEHNGQPYLSMELLDGLDLGMVVEEGGVLPVAEACEVIRQAALGLAHAHSQGLVHRDIKPSNLLLTTDGVVKILDLGLVGQNDERSETPQPQPVMDRGFNTEGDQLLGTPSFMSPEQCRGAKVGPTSDLYSLGATLYYLLTTRPPFSGKAYASLHDRIEAIKSQDPPSITDRRPELPQALAEIVRRLLSRSDRDRYQSAEEVAVALKPLARGANPKRLLPDHRGADHQTPTRRTPSALTRRNAVVAMAAGLLIALSLFFVATPTPEGTLCINFPTEEANGADLKAELTREGTTKIVSAQVGWTISLAAGDWRVRLSEPSEDFALDRDSVTITAGEELTIQIKRRAASQPVSRSEESALPKAVPSPTAFDGPDPFRAEWDLQVDLYIGAKTYQLDSEGVLTLPDLNWRFQDRYVGRSGNRTVIDERITLVLIDRPNGFWPVIARLTIAEAKRLDEQLKRLCRRRDSVDEGRKTVSARLSTGPYTAEQFGQIKLPQKLRWEATTGSQEGASDFTTLVLRDTAQNSPPLEISLPVDQARQLRTDLANAVKRKRASMKQRVALRAPDDFYVGARGGAGQEVTVVGRRPGPTAVFTLEWKNAQRTQGTLRTRNGHYLHAVRGGGAAVDAREKDPETSGVFEFEWLDKARSEARLRTRDGYYLRIVDGKVDAVAEGPAEATPLRIVGAP